MVVPSVFEERTLRVFSRRRDPGLMESIQKAFRKCVRQRCSSAGLTPHPLSRLHSPLKVARHPVDSSSSDVFAAAMGRHGPPLPLDLGNDDEGDDDDDDEGPAGETPLKKKNRLK